MRTRRSPSSLTAGLSWLFDPTTGWTIEGFPELQTLAPSERREALRRVRARRIQILTALRALFLGFLVGLGVFVFLPPTKHAHAMLLAVPLGLVAAVLLYRARLVSLRVHLRREIERRSGHDRLPVCLSCGYDATGTAADRCPECGALLRRPATSTMPP